MTRTKRKMPPSVIGGEWRWWGCDELPETVEEPLEGRKNRQRESEVKGNCFGAEGV